MKKTVLILADTNLLIDGRIRRHIFFLKDNYNLIVTGTNNPNIEQFIDFIDCSKKSINLEELDRRRRLLRYRMNNKKFEEAYWEEEYIKELYVNLKDKKIDIILANDISIIPLGVKIAKERGIKIIADMHEYAPKEFSDDYEWNCLFADYKYYLCATYLKECDEIITVSKGIAKEFKKEFGIKVNVLTNAPKCGELEIKETNSTSIKIVYHGVANSSRKIENILSVVEKLDNRFSLDLYLIEDGSDHYENLVRKINYTSRCNLKKAVPPEEIVEMLHKYDIGIFLLEPVNLNYEYALPNKFFEFVQASLAVAIGPSKEMKNYVEKYKCGVVSKDFNPETLADKLNSLTTQDIDKYKKNSNELSKVENAENNKLKLLELIKGLD
ncbi:glycosyltransferase [uncultured Clostridium sp.]|uniref:glycosyltransferase n=1 Tax=uncultured Clostridium sp. TaxID=59620 RepID=UPI0028E4B843|nr:glycosyltransferase [uncultured Clostridium sp.]